MKNYIQPGGTIGVAAPRAVLAGAGVLVGGIFGLANHAAAQDELVQISRSGVFGDVAKATGAAWAVGDKLYWDNTNFVLTKTASGNTLVGAATDAAASGDAVGAVLLDGVIR